MAEVAARESAQEQLLQAQKMESVGQLTGGIAHDFNNLLMAIMGNLEILRKRLPEDPSIRRLIDGARQGAQRGASLTQRMLAFARQQDLRTTSADLGALVRGMQELLRRSLGPNNELHLYVEPHLPPAEVDAHQVELAILNLAINARDAMPDGGVIQLRVDQKQVTAGLERLQARLGVKAFRHRDDRDLTRVSTGMLDALAHRGQAFPDGHFRATIAPNRTPSGLRRWDGQ